MEEEEEQKKTEEEEGKEVRTLSFLVERWHTLMLSGTSEDAAPMAHS